MREEPCISGNVSAKALRQKLVWPIRGAAVPLAWNRAETSELGDGNRQVLVSQVMQGSADHCTDLGWGARVEE